MRNEHWGGASAWPWAGFAFGRRGRFFESGEIRLAILSLLSEGPKHGYQLMKEMEERSGGLYRASAGSVYPTLQQLEDEGLIESAQQSGKRAYQITELGRKELESEPETVRRIWERAERCEDWRQFMGAPFMGPDAMLLLGPITELMRAGFRAVGRVGRQPGGLDRVRDILERTRRELDQL